MMRKEYEKPIVEVVEFETKEQIAYEGTFDVVSLPEPSAHLLDE